MKERYASPEPVASQEKADKAASELKAWAAGEAGVGWRAELWYEKKRQYNRRYRSRHAERLRANKPIYNARYKAKFLGLPQPPLPTPKQRPKGVQIEGF